MILSSNQSFKLSSQTKHVQTSKVPVHKGCNQVFFICPIAIAYSMGQIIKSVCVCLSVCVSVCPCVVTLTVAFLCRLSPNLTQRCKTPKVRTSSLGSISPHPFPYFTPKNRHFWPRDPENPCKRKQLGTKLSRLQMKIRVAGCAN